MGKKGHSRRDQRGQYNTAHALCMLDKQGDTHTHTQNILHLVLSHGSSGYAQTPECYVIGALPVLFC